MAKALAMNSMRRCLPPITSRSARAGNSDSVEIGDCIDAAEGTELYRFAPVDTDA